MDMQVIFSALMQLSKEASSAASEVSQVFQFTPMEFVHNLKYMGLGMLGIFIVIALIIGATYLLNAAGSRKKKKDSKEQ